MTTFQIFVKQNHPNPDAFFAKPLSHDCDELCQWIDFWVIDCMNVPKKAVKEAENEIITGINGENFQMINLAQIKMKVNHQKSIIRLMEKQFFT